MCLTAINIDDAAVPIAFAGDNTVLTLSGIDSTNLSIGNTPRCSSILFCMSILWLRKLTINFVINYYKFLLINKFLIITNSVSHITVNRL